MWIIAVWSFFNIPRKWRLWSKNDLEYGTFHCGESLYANIPLSLLFGNFWLKRILLSWIFSFYISDLSSLNTTVIKFVKFQFTYSFFFSVYHQICREERPRDKINKICIRTRSKKSSKIINNANKVILKRLQEKKIENIITLRKISFRKQWQI